MSLDYAVDFTIILGLLIWNVAGTFCYVQLDGVLRGHWPLRLCLWTLAGPLSWILILARHAFNGIRWH